MHGTWNIYLKFINPLESPSLWVMSYFFFLDILVVKIVPSGNRIALRLQAKKHSLSRAQHGCHFNSIHNAWHLVKQTGVTVFSWILWDWLLLGPEQTTRTVDKFQMWHTTVSLPQNCAIPSYSFKVLHCYSSYLPKSSRAYFLFLWTDYWINATLTAR
jgi:hypothetical protein